MFRVVVARRGESGGKAWMPAFAGMTGIYGALTGAALYSWGLGCRDECGERK